MKEEWKGSDMIFWSELRHPDSTKRSVQICYALLMADHREAGAEYWRAINSAVCRRFKLRSDAQLGKFQARAKEIYARAAAQPSYKQQATPHVVQKDH